MMATFPEKKAVENGFPEEAFEIIAGLTVVRVVREYVPILEHTSGLRGSQCFGQLGREVEIAKDNSLTIICRKCDVAGMIEALDG